MLLELGDNQRTSPPAPPEGLYFVWSTYPRDLFIAGDDAADAAAPPAPPRGAVVPDA
jgi:hypothetical protein